MRRKQGTRYRKVAAQIFRSSPWLLLTVLEAVQLESPEKTEQCHGRNLGRLEVCLERENIAFANP